MANLTQTAASVVGSSTATRQKGFNFGATVTQGQPVYLDSTTNTWKIADANPTGFGQGVNDTVGIAENAGSSGQPACVVLLDKGGINLGATLVVGMVYVVSATAGSIAPITDLVSTDFPIVLGVASTAALLILQPVAGGAAKP